MITLIVGPPGVGKTSLMTSFAVTEITNYEDIFCKQEYIKSLNDKIADLKNLYMIDKN